MFFILLLKLNFFIGNYVFLFKINMVDVNIDVFGKDFVNKCIGLNVVCLVLMERMKIINIDNI